MLESGRVVEAGPLNGLKTYKAMLDGPRAKPLRLKVSTAVTPKQTSDIPD